MAGYPPLPKADTIEINSRNHHAAPLNRPERKPRRSETIRWPLVLRTESYEHVQFPKEAPWRPKRHSGGACSLTCLHLTFQDAEGGMPNRVAWFTCPRERGTKGANLFRV